MFQRQKNLTVDKFRMSIRLRKFHASQPTRFFFRMLFLADAHVFKGSDGPLTSQT